MKYLEDFSKYILLAIPSVYVKEWNRSSQSRLHSLRVKTHDQKLMFELRHEKLRHPELSVTAALKDCALQVLYAACSTHFG